VAHEKTIAQSRDRQGADPLADARGSVRTSIFEAEYPKTVHSLSDALRSHPRYHALLRKMNLEP
jgi:hypothetical protein